MQPASGTRFWDRLASGRSGGASGVLTASALVFGGAILWNASNAWSQPAAQSGSGRGAGMVSRAGEVTSLTVNTGNEDALVVLDGRTEQIYVYRGGVRDGLQIVQRIDLTQTFVDARARFMGAP
jgi:hypothetical protein